MYRNILVPVLFDDDHDNAASIEVARALAEDGAAFTLLHVVENIPGYVAIEIPDAIFARTRDDLRNKLSTLATQLPGAQTVLVSGHAGREIVDYAANHGVDCIVVASHVPGLEDLLLGGTADRVVRHAKCAVHVIR